MIHLLGLAVLVILHLRLVLFDKFLVLSTLLYAGVRIFPLPLADETSCREDIAIDIARDVLLNTLYFLFLRLHELLLGLKLACLFLFTTASLGIALLLDFLQLFFVNLTLLFVGLGDELLQALGELC